MKLAKMAGFSRILRMAVMWHHNPKSISPSVDYPSIQRRSPGRACELLRKNPRIVPRGVLVYDWKALDNTCQNLEEIGKTHTFYIALKRRKLDSLSLGRRGQEPNEPFWGFTVYATESCGFLSQLSHNAAKALENGLDSIACTFETRFEKTVDGLDLGSGEHEKTHVVLLEKAL
jgi:hypothetical protein